MTGRPLDVLEETLGEVVTVCLKDGEAFEGRLTGYDQHMNLVLEGVDAEDADPDVEVPTEPRATSVRGTTIIRGDNVVSISP